MALLEHKASQTGLASLLH